MDGRSLQRYITIMEVPNASLNQPKLEMFRKGAQLSKCLLQLQNKTKFKT